MPGQIARQEEIERRLVQSRRLLKDANDPTTTARIDKLITELEQEQVEGWEK